MDAAVEVAVARQHGGRVQVAVDDLLLDLRVQRAATCRCRWCRRSRRCRSRASRVPAAAPLLPDTAARPWSPAPARSSPTACACRPSALALRASRPAAITLRGLLVLVQQVIAAMITAPSGISPGFFFPLAARCRARQGPRSAGACADSTGPAMLRTTRGQVELQHALVFGGRRALSAHRPAVLRVGLDQLHLLVVAAGELQVVDGLLVDVEHRRGGAVFRRHVGDGRAVAEGEADAPSPKNSR